MLSGKSFREAIEYELKRANNVASDTVSKCVESYHGIFSEVLKENINISKNMEMPLCQDTGIVEFFVFRGRNVRTDFSITEILEECVRNVYASNPYRYSTVEDPLFSRINSGNNLPPVIHFFEADGEKIEIRFLIKGGGSENLSFLKMMNPSSSEEEIIDEVVSHIRSKGAKSCPPLHIGVGLGGTSDKAMLLAKLALTEKPDSHNNDGAYALLEKKMTDRLNKLNIGFQGLGKGITVYSVHVKPYPTHIATLPLAIAVDCYLCRKGCVEFEF